MIFHDRADAGRALAQHLATYRGRADLTVLALPRGGVPVAFEVASALDAPLDVFVVRKLGTPGQRELAMGAIASGGVRVLNDDVVSALGITPDVIDAVAQSELQELERRERAFREGRPPADIKNRLVLLIDDGLATGATMRAAIHAVRQLEPRRVIVAVPVAARETCQDLGGLADEVVCLNMPVPFSAVGRWYMDFEQTSDEEVRELLRRSAARTSA